MTAIRYLDLRDDCIASPTPYDVAIVGGMMLWPRPEDEEVRRRALHAVIFEQIYLQGNFPQPEMIEERRQLRDMILSVPQVTDFESNVKAGFRRGLIAGAILNDALPKQAGDSPRKMQPVKQTIADRFGISVSLIDGKIWPGYKCVAPYWATYIRRGRQSDHAPIPCARTDLGQFLIEAIDLSNQAKSQRGHHSPQAAILPPGTIIEVPKTVDFSPVLYPKRTAARAALAALRRSTQDD